jgi:hypothetical protein
MSDNGSIFQHHVRGFGPLGEIRIRDLRAVAETLTATATTYDDAVDALTLRDLWNRCVAIGHGAGRPVCQRR